MKRVTRRTISLLGSIRVTIFVLALLLAEQASAQQMAPRAYWPAPKGTRLALVGAGYQAGDVVTDPTLAIENADSRLTTAAVGYQQTIALFGRTSNVQFELPFANGTTRVALDGQALRRDVSGIGDVAATLSLNLYGAPSMNLEEFQAFRANPGPIVGASIKVVAPTGQYDNDKIINIGNNRWATRLRLGYIQPLGRAWVLEMAAGTWFFQDNDDFLGVTRKQKPVTAFDLSIIRRISPGYWLSVDATHYIGGRTTVDDTIKADYQRNVRLGFSLAYPFKKRHVWKLSFSNEISTEFGGDYSTIGLSYFYRL